MKSLLPIILSGGIGSRLWPLSRETNPKPFIKLDDGESLIQKTYSRALNLGADQEIVTVTNRDLFFYTKDEFDALEEKANLNTFLLEPFGRNSTAAIAVAAHYAIARQGSDSTLLILPADHLIDNIDAFAAAVSEAMELANQGKLVTFGIKPNAPKTGFGYIEVSDQQVTRFVEKPDHKTAEAYIAAGNFLWNSGMFCMQAGVFIAKLERLCPDIAQQSFKCFDNSQSSAGAGWKQHELRKTDFSSVRDISVDYAVFEKSENVAVVPCDIGWSDIGSWTDFGGLHPSDEQHNNIAGKTLLQDTRNCIVHGGEKLIATLGIENLIVADTADALLVAHKDRAQDVRNIVKKLKANNQPSYREFPTVHRPWGTYTVLHEGIGFKLKCIEVKPGASLSLQSHKYRSEHWVVVSGVALVTHNQEVIKLQRNESTYIPAGNKHRLENKQAEPLVIIEVQSGSYLGEDDIERYDDLYERPLNPVKSAKI